MAEPPAPLQYGIICHSHHRAGRAMKIPYGLSNFKKVITEGFVYDVKY
ncbi:hypothetical protein [Thiothrix lacustris]|nr:hypothetical protein [Thiothrix lacustris]WMP17084.1 hypothetical protein RCS87_17130 [Thiothrix lacustris]